jgi:putative hydrolase of the HAD superfamily
MDNIQLISVDLFQTLVDIESRKEVIWRLILQDAYTLKRSEHCWAITSKILREIYLAKAATNNGFEKVRAIFRECFVRAFAEIGLDFDPDEAARILAHQHSLSNPFEDAIPFLKGVGHHRLVCLTSDTDDDMIGPLGSLFPFDHIFTSEALETYKINRANSFFKKVLKHYRDRGIRAENILHIGDSSADIFGAAYAGIRSCWLNRRGIAWEHEIRPDFIVTSLWQALDLFDDGAQAANPMQSTDSK